MAYIAIQHKLGLNEASHTYLSKCQRKLAGRAYCTMFNKHLKQEIASLQTQVSQLRAVEAAIDRSNAVIHFDLNCNVTAANANFLRTMGYERLEQILGKPHSQFCDS